MQEMVSFESETLIFICLCTFIIITYYQLSGTLDQILKNKITELKEEFIILLALKIKLQNKILIFLNSFISPINFFILILDQLQINKIKLFSKIINFQYLYYFNFIQLGINYFYFKFLNLKSNLKFKEILDLITSHYRPYQFMRRSFNLLYCMLIDSKLNLSKLNYVYYFNQKHMKFQKIIS
jgi:hypothetical protein